MFQDPKSFSPSVALPRDLVKPRAPEPKPEPKQARSTDTKSRSAEPKPLHIVDPKPAARPEAEPVETKQWWRASDFTAGSLFGIDLGFVLRRKSWLMMSVAAALALALAYHLAATPRYRAVAQILISPTDLRVLEKSALQQNAQTADASVIQVESETRVLTSDKVLLRVIDAQKLTDDPEFGGSGGSWMNVLSPNNASIDAQERTVSPRELAALRALQRAVTAKRTERTYVVDLVVDTAYAQKSARIANAVTAAYLDEQASSRMEAARRVSDSLSARLSELKECVRHAEEAVELFKSQNNIVGAGGRLVSEQQLADLNSQLTAARTKTAEAKARYERSLQQGDDAGSTSEAVQSNTIGRLREQHATVARQEATLSAELGVRHPYVIEARAQVRNVERLISDELSRLAAANRLDYERALDNENALNRSLDALKQRAVETNMAFVKLRELEREVEAGRAVYEAFLVRARETREQERLDSANVRVLSDAQPARDRFWPPRLLILLLAGLAIGAISGVGMAYAAEQMQRPQLVRERN